MDKKARQIPYIDEFRSFILNGFHIPQDHIKKCKSNQTVLFIWRRNYVAHPRNPSGVIDRKIKNEDELLEASRQAFPSFNITVVQLDLLPMRKHCRAISSSDIFIGMH